MRTLCDTGLNIIPSLYNFKWLGVEWMSKSMQHSNNTVHLPLNSQNANNNVSYTFVHTEFHLLSISQSTLYNVIIYYIQYQAKNKTHKKRHSQ